MVTEKTCEPVEAVLLIATHVGAAVSPWVVHVISVEEIEQLPLMKSTFSSETVPVVATLAIRMFSQATPHSD